MFTQSSLTTMQEMWSTCYPMSESINPHRTVHMSKDVERQKMNSSKRHEKKRLCCTILQLEFLVDQHFCQ
jgi:hypothetical protein